MGRLIDGKWHADGTSKTTDGRFVREDASFRNWVTADGSAGPSGVGGFSARPHRYHLYVSFACPWAHRTLIARRCKGLEGIISLSVVNPVMGDHGWTFEHADGVIPDPHVGATYLYEVYLAAAPRFTGRVTVPVLWDNDQHTIVSNESAEILRMFNSEFADARRANDNSDSSPPTDSNDWYPPKWRDEIDRINERVYRTVNNGVYRAGFARTQEAYDEAVADVFATLDWLEARLATRRYLVGNRPTEADWRLFTTLIRFDPVYNGHFKCNLRRLVDYPHLWSYTLDLYQRPGIAEVTNFHHIRHHYYRSHDSINPTGIVPVGPKLDYSRPPNREHLA